MNNPLGLPPEALRAMREHALAEYPKESCGVVAGLQYIPCRNVAEDPKQHFAIDPHEVLRVCGGDPTAVIHSHPDGPDHPSKSDMEQQMAMEVPWGIVLTNGKEARDPFWFGDQVPTPPLLMRPFRHGVTDCYSLVRDYFKLERGILLPDFPRDWDWWHNGGDLYREGFRKVGFEAIPEGATGCKPGDCFMAQIMSKVPNHAGVYVGDGLILHHLQNRVSRREPAHNWRKYITLWVRYVR